MSNFFIKNFLKCIPLEKTTFNGKMEFSKSFTKTAHSIKTCKHIHFMSTGKVYTSYKISHFKTLWEEISEEIFV